LSIKHKVIQAMKERDASKALTGMVQNVVVAKRGGVSQLLIGPFNV
jgi:hypothetical protein